MEKLQVPVVNLKTHNVYPEIVTDDDGNWTGKLIARNGDVLEKWEGKVTKPKSPITMEARLAMRRECAVLAWNEFLKVIDKYVKKAPEVAVDNTKQ